MSIDTKKLREWANFSTSMSPDVVLALLDEIERLTRGRDEMIDAVIEGPLNGRTSHDEILSLRTQLQAARAECERLHKIAVELAHRIDAHPAVLVADLGRIGPRKDGGE